MKPYLLPGLAVLALLSATLAGAAELTVTTRGGKGEPVADAAVALIPLDAPVPPPAPARRTEIAQQNQEYSSYVTIVQAGSTVVFPNKDSVQHHVYSLSKAKKFELPLYNPGQAESFVFDVSGVVTLGCNIHDWMLAYLVVVPTPWFGKTDGLGAAIITAPAGRYRLQLWHPRMTAAITEEITLAENRENRREFTVTLKPDRRVRRGPPRARPAVTAEAVAIRVFRFRRFSSQLLLLLAGLIALVQITVYLLISRANYSNAVDHIEQNLQTGARIFQQNLAERIDYLAGSAKVVASDYPVRQLMMQDPVDPRTLRSALVTYSERVNAPVITLFSTEGEVIALTDDELGTENVGPFKELIRQATRDDLEQISGYSYLANRLHVLVVVPLYAPAPNVAAWFGVAYPIDTKLAQAIKNTTRLEVTFMSDDPEVQPPRILSTTLNAPMAEALTRHMATGQKNPLRSEVVNLKGDPYVTLYQRLDLLGEAPVRIALQRPLMTELAPARELENMVLLISLAALAAATLAALWIARGVSQPLQQLAGHTQHVAAGDYTRHIDLPRADELGQLATAFNSMTAGLAERDRVRDLLGKVVSPEIATQLLQSDLKLGGEEREVTILFCDLRDFTGMSEKMSPTDLLALLNRYLDRMSTIIERHGGVIDKYIGDAIMALFGAPVVDPGAAGKAIAAAREMAQALNALNRELVAEGKPALLFGIGINTARVIAGNMGSKTRLNYTVIGDGVNLASRLEALTKEPAYDTPIIISEATLRALPNPPPARGLGEVKVKGKAGTVKIFALGAKGESTPPYAV